MSRDLHLEAGPSCQIGGRKSQALRAAICGYQWLTFVPCSLSISGADVTEAVLESKSLLRNYRAPKTGPE
jgi:hypothetical protein